MDATTLTSFFKQANEKIKHFQFGNKAQLAFLEDLYLLINDGIPANRAIEMMAKATRGVARDVARSLARKVAEGQALAEGMREWFAPSITEIIRVGEAGGALAETLKSAINSLGKRNVAVGSFLGAVFYPAFVLVTACSVIVYINSTVFPQFLLIKPNLSDWPAAGLRLMAIADFIKTWWWLVILILIAIPFILRKIMDNYVGEWRPQLDQFPPFSFYKRFAAARLLETLGLLVANGVVFKAAIRVMQYQANPYMGFHLAAMEHLLSTGKTNIADVLDTGLIKQEDLARLRIMAEVKGFEHGLIRMGINGTEQATNTIKTISRIIGGILLICGGGLIMVIISGIYLTGMAMGS